MDLSIMSLLVVKAHLGYLTRRAKPEGAWGGRDRVFPESNSPSFTESFVYREFHFLSKYSTTVFHLSRVYGSLSIILVSRNCLRFFEDMLFTKLIIFFITHSGLKYVHFKISNRIPCIRCNLVPKKETISKNS